MLWIITGTFISYLLGSIPTAYIFGRLIKGVDIRKFGSGNVGATNAIRVLGKPAGISVLLLDILKGFAAVSFLGDIIVPRAPGTTETVLRLILGFSCIAGHNWTIFLGFKGGKGVATTLGVLLGLAVDIPGIKMVFAMMILTWLIVFAAARIVSLASIISTAALPLYMFLFKQPPVLIYSSILLCVFIILRHKSNLKRLMDGKETRLK
ncbi:MAG: glycerol-3-phosphate 1-O-acyltransferase PlsY [Candidatus Omnitrophota bacterium]|jgi:glycerol-3-phosphate acyltransferase PlsY